jgi:hypothetical protein
VSCRVPGANFAFDSADCGGTFAEFIAQIDLFENFADDVPLDDVPDVLFVQEMVVD